MVSCQRMYTKGDRVRVEVTSVSQSSLKAKIHEFSIRRSVEPPSGGCIMAIATPCATVPVCFALVS